MVKRVVITGPTGAIGIALINCLIENGIEVLAVCREDSKRINSIPNHNLVKIVKLNLNEIYKLSDIMCFIILDGRGHLEILEIICGDR